MAAPMPAADGRVPRLVIVEMELENFKSYAGVQRVGPFHKRFSSVVGPNGSGKSNVIDAMLFVFGKRAKQLRLHKVGELVHRSARHPDCECARVTVRFQRIVDSPVGPDGSEVDPEAFEVVPGSRFEVTRTAHASNRSDYFVDGRKSSFGEVTALFRSFGVDLDNNRFLILQGEVEAISGMPPKGATEHDVGLLEYLEDVVGTAPLNAPLREAAEQLERAQDLRAAAARRAAAAKREREALDGDRLAAEAYLEAAAESRRLQLLLDCVALRDAAKNVQSAETDLERIQARLDASRDDDRRAGEAAARAKDAAAAADDARAEAREALRGAAERFAEFERKDVRLRGDLKAAKAAAAKADAKAARERAKADDAGERRARAERLAPGADSLAAEAAARADDLERQAEEAAARAEAAAGPAKAALDAALEAAAPSASALAAARAARAEAAAEAEASGAGARSTAEAVERARQGLERARADADGGEARVAELRGELEAARGEAAALRERAGALALQAADAGARARSLRAEAAREATARQGQRQRGAALAALAAAARRGELRGVLGRLGDLGAVPARYDAAASTAAGALDMIVVETTADAQRAVELLRRERAGVASFLILERQARLRAAAEAAPPRTPRDLPRLLDLVRVADPRARVAFYHAFRDTIVAASLEEASLAAAEGRPRFSRVVTLNGETLDEVGTLSGGGQPRRGAMRLGDEAPPPPREFRPGDAARAAAGGARGAAAGPAPPGAAAAAGGQTPGDEDLARAAAEAAREAQRLEREAADAAEAAREADARVRRLEGELARCRVALAAAQEAAEGMRARAAELEAEAARSRAASEAASAAAEDALAAADRALEAAEKAAAPPQAAVERARAALEAARKGGAAGKARDEAARARKAAREADAAAAARRAEAEAAAREAARSLRACEAAEAEAEAARERAQVATRALRELEEAAAEVVRAQGALQAQLEAAEAAAAGARREAEAAEAAEAARRRAAEELEAERVSRRAALKEARAAASRAEARARRAAAPGEHEHDGEALAMPSEAEVAGADAEAVSYRITMLNQRQSAANVDLSVLRRWREADAASRAADAELEAAAAARDGARAAHEALRARRLAAFAAGLGAVAARLKEMYQLLTLGGDAELEPVDSLDPFSEGLRLSVRPPRKSWKNVANLSGGERTLASLALVFALHHYRPTPIYVMDEIDAALDLRNVAIVGRYVKERTKNAQFVVISLRDAMFELADRLVGIYKTHDATKSITIEPKAFLAENRNERKPHAKSDGKAQRPNGQGTTDEKDDRRRRTPPSDKGNAEPEGEREGNENARPDALSSPLAVA